MSTQTPDDALTPPLTPTSARPDVQRRRRELALTAKWLRELRGATQPVGRPRPAGRFTRPVKN